MTATPTRVLVGTYRAGFANYRGDMRSIVGEVKGPTTYGRPVLAVDAVYDEATDRTRVQFAHISDEDCRTLVRQFGWVLPGVTV